MVLAPQTPPMVYGIHTPSGSSHEVETSLTGNPFINQTETWSARLAQEWFKFLDYADAAMYIQNYCELQSYLMDDGGDSLLTTDRVYYNKITKKLVLESNSFNWFTNYTIEKTVTDMTEEEIIDEYTSVGFKLVGKTSVGVSLQRIDHSNAGKHLYHIDDRRALNIRISIVCMI
mmetsp:Transcript_516/g.784  ORF Transcript_516/g.784 Transcript_516/m.784 type:complete len:174 (+) Transcript_516:149-670(+)